MIRHKYKYSKNHGLLPKPKLKSPSSLLTSIAITTRNDTQQYRLHRNPYNPNIIMLFNDQQYLHRECSAIIDRSQQNVLEELANKIHFQQSSLTIYVTNNHDHCTNNIIGDSSAKNALIWQTYKNLNQGKAQGTYISLSILGIQNENDLTDLLSVQLTESLGDLNPQSFLRKKIRINKSEGKWQPTNAQILVLQSQEELVSALQRYKQIKNTIEYTAFMSAPKWDWLQGQIYVLSQIQYDQAQQTIVKTFKSHYILRVNQYLRSVSSIMLKLGIQIRKMQQNTSKTVLQNNQSKLFRLINHCFGRNENGVSLFHANLILQIGHYESLKEEYQNLVPTSELLSQRANLKQDQVQNASFLYIKHFSQYPSLVTLLAKVSNNMAQKQLSLNTPLYNVKNEISLRGRIKSYVCDTYSSMQKRNIKKQLIIQEFAETDAKFIDVQQFIRRTAKQYRNDGDKQEVQQFQRASKSTIKKSQKNEENRMSSFDWNVYPQKQNLNPKMYISRREVNKSKVIEERRSISYLIDNKFQRSKPPNNSNLQSIYGVRVRRNREFPKFSKPKSDLSKIRQRKSRKQNQIADELLRQEIIELGKDDEYLKQSNSSVEQILH